MTIWNWESQYTAADWAKIFDSFARDGLNEVYFWVSGHFPSKRYPQTYKVADAQYDTTKDSKIGTLDDIIIGQNRAMYAVVQVGGFLGINAHLVAVPYQSLVIDEAGKKIELILRDDAGVADNARRLVQEMIVNDKVNIIAGGITPTALAYGPLVTQAKIATVVMISCASVTTTACAKKSLASCTSMGR